jgi:4-hydroxy-2-oxoheptanedioate aldolase
MRRNHVREKLRRGETSIGTWLSLPDSTAARLMARVGFDWLTVDLEHSATNFETAAASFAQIALEGPAPLARVPWNTGENIKRVLDNGAWGVIVPMVNSRAAAESAVQDSRYAPLGVRSVGGQLHAPNFDTDPGTYYQRANDEILVVLMAEHVKSIEALEDIAKVPGIDAFFIGPNDLCSSMGLKPGFDSDDPGFQRALRHVVDTARKHGIAPGIHVADAAMAQRRIAEGFRFIAVASEAGFMLAKASETAKTLELKAKGPVARY